VSFSQYWDDNRWVKLFNGTDSSINLSEYSIKTNAFKQSDINQQSVHSFLLPNIELAAGESIVIQDSFSKEYWSSNSASPHHSFTFEKQNNDMQFGWYRSGFVELQNTKALQTIDFVRFGESKMLPNDQAQWLSKTQKDGLQENMGKPYVRIMNKKDSNSNRDWQYLSNN